MKNEMVFEMIEKARAAMNGDDLKAFDTARKFLENGVLCYADLCAGKPAQALAALYCAAVEDLKTANAKKAGRGDAKKAIEKILKTAPQDFLKKARIIDNMQYVCNGFILFALSAPVELSAEYTQENNDGRLDGIIKNVLNAARQNTGAALAIPSKDSLTAYIKQQKAAKKAQRDKSYIRYDFGENKPAVNAEYLQYIIDIYGAGVTLTASAYNTMTGAIYIKSDAGDGVIMPVRKQANAATA